jgi:hypothetical protein
METFTQAAMMLFQTVVGKKKGLSFNFLLMKIRISEDPLVTKAWNICYLEKTTKAPQIGRYLR